MIFDPHVHFGTFPSPTVGKPPLFLPPRNLFRVRHGGEPGRHRKLRQNTAGAVVGNLITTIYLKAIFKKVDMVLPFLSRIWHFYEHREVIFFAHLTPICWRVFIQALCSKLTEQKLSGKPTKNPPPDRKCLSRCYYKQNKNNLIGKMQTSH